MVNVNKEMQTKTKFDKSPHTYQDNYYQEKKSGELRTFMHGWW